MNRRSIDRAISRRGAGLVLAAAGLMAVAGSGSAIAAGEWRETGTMTALLMPMLLSALFGLAIGWMVQPAAIIDVPHSASAVTLAQDAARDPTSDQAKRLSELSHALRTPLNSVIGFSELMRGEVFGPLGSQKYRDYADHIQDGAQVLLARVDDIIQAADASHGGRHAGPPDRQRAA